MGQTYFIRFDQRNYVLILFKVEGLAGGAGDDGADGGGGYIARDRLGGGGCIAGDGWLDGGRGQGKGQLAEDGAAGDGGDAAGQLVADADEEWGCGAARGEWIGWKGDHDLGLFEEDADSGAFFQPGACVGGVEDEGVEEVAFCEDLYQGDGLFGPDVCDLSVECVHVS